MFYDWLPTRAPAWLQRTWGRAWNAGVGLLLDAFSGAAKLAVYARFPSYAPPDALDVMGDECQLPRINVLAYESDTAFASRLLDKWNSKADQGTKTGLLSILEAIGNTVASPWTYDVFDQDEWNPLSNWSHGWILIQKPHPWDSDGNWGDPGTWGDGGTWGSSATPEQVENYRAVVKPWIPAHAKIVSVVHLDGEVWGEPGTWGDPGTWGGSVAQWKHN